MRLDSMKSVENEREEKNENGKSPRQSWKEGAAEDGL
jgi:hypothetical protein